MPARKKREPFTQALREEYLNHIENGMRRGAAAEVIGLTRKHVLAFISLHENFEAEVLAAEDVATEHVEEALYQAAISGNVPACRMWLDLKRGGGDVELPSSGGDLDRMLAEMNELAGD